MDEIEAQTTWTAYSLTRRLAFGRDLFECVDDLGANKSSVCVPGARIHGDVIVEHRLNSSL